MKVKSDEVTPAPAPEEILGHPFHPQHRLKLAGHDAAVEEFVCLLCTTGEGSRHCHRHRRKHWTYSSDDIDGEAVHLHVACVKKMAFESSVAGCTNGRNAQVITAPVQTMALLQQKKGKSRSALKKLVKIVVFALRVVVGVLFGDPTAIAVAVVQLIFPNG
ncbi:uncharacterized protein LOC107304725 [Oryza brachyantha]|uniref:uncharacterized protein LOC107304725 n=1 Tax=Oryza brachyantha TaxID=4533 RepID=UPI00077664E4|nr:uncharacterized protein LOC107304725 [Oryza brachyantha]